MKDRKCMIPQTVSIGRSDDTAKLYAAEDKLAKALQAAAKELGKVLEHPEAEFWTSSMSAAILAMLENTQREAAVAACVGFLRANGLIVDIGRAVSANVRGCKRKVYLLESGEVQVEFIER